MFKFPVISSKSYLNRYLILASLVEREVVLKYIDMNEDSLYLINALIKLGVNIETSDSEVIVKGNYLGDQTVCNSLELEIGEGGTTLRFIIALLALGKCRKYVLRTKGKLSQRPHDELLLALGFDYVWKDNTLELSPQKKSIDLSKLKHEKSSQYYSAIKMVSVELGIDIKINEEMASKTYAQMTDHCIHIIKQQSIIDIKADWSSAAFGFVWGALIQDSSIEIERDRFQADSNIVDILKSAGVRIEDGHRVFKGSNFGQIDVDISITPDLFPVLSVFSCFSKETSIFRNVKILAFKESNRIEQMKKIITAMGADFVIRENLVEITGADQLKYPLDQVADDHRVVMALAIAQKAINGEIKVPNIYTCKKSFPSFLDII